MDNDNDNKNKIYVKANSFHFPPPPPSRLKIKTTDVCLYYINCCSSELTISSATTIITGDNSDTEVFVSLCHRVHSP